MHIVIDKGTLVFLPIKHRQLSVVCDLVHIEAPYAHVYVCPLDKNFLNQFTDLELMLLYKNTTKEQAMRTGDSLRNILFELANRIEVREVNVLQLSLQANQIPERGSKRYTYQHNAIKPFEKDTFFKLDAVVLPKAPNEPTIAITARTNV